MKIICIGRNYAQHVVELDHTRELPKVPQFFMKPDTALLRNNDPFYVPDFSQEVHYETELVVKINRVGRAIMLKWDWASISPHVICNATA